MGPILMIILFIIYNILLFIFILLNSYCNKNIIIIKNKNIRKSILFKKYVCSV